MNRTGRTLALGCLLLLQPLLANAQAGGNSLLIPAMGRCTLNTQPQDLAPALDACRKAADAGDAQAQYELGEFYYDGKAAPRDLKQALGYFEKPHCKAMPRRNTSWVACSSMVKACRPTMSRLISS